MQACSNCGQRKTAAKAYCTWCGASFGHDGNESAGQGSAPPAVAWDPPKAATPARPVEPHAGSVEPPKPPRPPAPGRARATAVRPRYLPAAVGAIGALALVGLGVGTWFLVAHLGTHATVDATQANGTVASGRTLGAPDAGTHSANPSGSSPTGGSPTASLGPSPTASAAATLPAGPVTIAPAAAANPAAPGILEFLDKYFRAINTHDYHAYMALRSSQMSTGFSRSVFDSGYGSTTDSREILTGISSASDDDFVADATFTSHQSAAQSPTGTRCNRWTISLYLEPDGGGYLMDSPPSSYHAKYAACG